MYMDNSYMYSLILDFTLLIEAWSALVGVDSEDSRPYVTLWTLH